METRSWICESAALGLAKMTDEPMDLKREKEHDWLLSYHSILPYFAPHPIDLSQPSSSLTLPASAGAPLTCLLRLVDPQAVMLISRDPNKRAE